MDINEFADIVAQSMDFEPTTQQRALIDALARFCSAEASPTSAFLINGYAGTGKTSVVAALVKALRSVRRPVVLLAPTGRAAKVLSSFAGQRAMTIHRKIYRSDGLAGVAGVCGNPHSNAIFIVDEASMIGSGEQTSLLDDLVQYVYSGDNCRMILLGDVAQLPPVGCDKSPAMDVENLRRLGLRVSRAMLTQTVRQGSSSGILYNATRLRRAMQTDPLPTPTLAVESFDDVTIVSGEDLADEISSAYAQYGIDNTILITRSNARAMKYNLAIRSTILEKEEELTRDEPLLVAKNNYFWTAKVKGADFLANGDVVVISAIYGTEIRGELRFADVQLAFPERENLTFNAKIILNSLTSDTAGLSVEHEHMLLEMAIAEHGSDAFNNPAIRAKIMHTDPYLNALRVKYAYAVTCHKAQGGQWQSVFVDMAGIAPEATTTIDFYRWLYTATTRASGRLNYVAPTIPTK